MYLIEDQQMVDRLRQSGMLVYTRQEFRNAMGDCFLQYAGLYHLFIVSPDLQILIAEEASWGAVEDRLRREVLQEQVRLNRGFIFDEAWLAELGDEFAEERERLLDRFGICPVVEDRAVVAQDDSLCKGSSAGKRVLVLTYEIWKSLGAAFQQKWFRKRLDELLAEYPSVAVTEAFAWPEGVSLAKRKLIETYAGRIAERSGPNCFATALALAIGGPASPAILQQWMHEAPFLRTLESIGYVGIGRDANLQTDDIVVWLNREGHHVHAAYVLTEELLFQKYGQNWFDPWAVVPYAEVADYGGSVSTGGWIEVYRKR